MSAAEDLTETSFSNVSRSERISLVAFFKKRTMRHIALQFIRYLAVGGVAFLVDYFFLNLCLHIGLHYLIGTVIGFIAGLATNYSLCVLWVWRGTKARTMRDIFVFTLIGIGGLALTALLMWISVDHFQIDPRIAKAVIAGIVLFWNFGLRRIFVFFR